MAKTKKAAAAGRAWKLLKLALVWVRKGGVFRRGQLAPGLRLVPSYLGSLRAAVRSDAIGNGEREFSFDETPIFHFKVHRPMRPMRLLLHHIPCISPPAADDDVDCDGIFDFGRNERECWLRWGDDDGAANSTTEQGGGGGGGEEEGRDTVVGRGLGHPPFRPSGSEASSTGGGGGGGGATALVLEEAEAEEKSSIDMEAEEFIAKFYEQMRLQRQISLLQYNEMLARSTG